MQLPVDQEFRAICKQIIKEARTLAEWAEIESGDMFQSARYCGGFEADEGAFTFSHYDEDGREIWFTVHWLTCAVLSRATSLLLKRGSPRNRPQRERRLTRGFSGRAAVHLSGSGATL